MGCADLSKFDIYKYALMCAVHERNEALEFIADAEKSLEFARAKLAKADRLLTEIEKTAKEASCDEQV